MAKKVGRWRRSRKALRTMRDQAARGDELAGQLLEVVQQQPRSRRHDATSLASGFLLIDAYRKAGAPFGPDGINQWVAWCRTQPPETIVVPDE